MKSQPQYGSDVIVDALRSFDIPYIALNPGATIRGLHDSLVNYGGDTPPQIVLTAHEELAVAMAHGFAKASGRPMAVGLHNIVGLQHATMAIFNAWMDRVPMLLLGGGGPLQETLRRPWIDWVHTAFHQGELVREFVKWDTQPFVIEAIWESFARAYDVAVTDPQGPVYICYDAGLQESQVPSELDFPDPKQFLTTRSLRADEEVLAEISTLLVNASAPVILASGLGRFKGVVDELVELADLLAIPVIDWLRGGISFPNRHPFDFTGDPGSVLKNADLVLSLNVRDLWAMTSEIDEALRQTNSLIPPTATIVQVGSDYLPMNGWSAEHGRLHRCDVRVPLGAEHVLPDLLQACKLRLSEQAMHSDVEIRRRLLSQRNLELHRRWSETQTSDEHLLSLASISAIVWEAVSGVDWVLVNGQAGGWPRRLWNWDSPDRYLGDSGGAGKGYGLGASIGASLALRETGKIAIDLQGDGDFLYTPAGLWTAAHYRVPLVIVMLNNRSYGVDERHQIRMARLRNRSIDNAHIGVRIDAPDIDYATMARSYGMAGIGPVNDGESFAKAMRQAIAYVAEKRAPILVDCRMG